MTKEQHDALMPSASDLEWHNSSIAVMPASIHISMRELLAMGGFPVVQCPRCNNLCMSVVNKDDPTRYVCDCGLGVAIGFDS